MKKLKNLWKNLFSPSYGEEDRVLTKNMLDVRLGSPGTLAQHLGKGNLQYISQLKILGNLDSTDVGVLRNMSHLEVLDLSEARIVVGGNYYINLNSATL